MVRRTNVLVSIAAHPDDETLSYGALLRRAAEFGWQIHLVWAANGKSSSTEPLGGRYDEAATVAKALNAKEYPLGLQNGCVTLDAKTIDAVEKIIKRLEPRVVVWPYGSQSNQHQDHIAINNVLTNIRQRSKIEGCSWIAGQPPVYADSTFNPNFFLSFGDSLLAQKQQLMDLYASESGKYFAKESFLRGKAEEWARLRNIIPPMVAEAFSIQLQSGRALSQLEHYPVEVLAGVDAHIVRLQELADLTALGSVLYWFSRLRHEGNFLPEPYRIGNVDEINVGYAGALVLLYVLVDGIFVVLHAIKWDPRIELKSVDEVPEHEINTAKRLLREPPE